MKKITLLAAAFVASLSIQAQTVITHSVEQTVTENNTVACPTEPTVYQRVFDFENEFNITDGFELTAVEFGVETIDASPVTLNIYLSDGTNPTTSDLTNIVSEEVTLTAADAGTVVSYTLAAPLTVPASSILVVELAEAADGTVFRIGSNQAGQTAPSWIISDTCGADTVEALGFTNHYVMNLVTDATLAVDSAIASQISMYPNPVNNVLNISVPSSIQIEGATMYDILGKGTQVEVSANNTINTSSLASGVYLLTINTNEGNITKKVVKQ
ncbi:T9SS type A sorting domain-containing protein [Mesonia sp. MT50]|uniref:T9SS type A sorting domain-containing protein n=1 Tax=Mesonia profundi TaxID=3070998 RepID=A0ABU0ZZQ5_9FLAO|nr:T9SS type A sorting domain-containing protein [Mesonia profundi]MDQ7916940.1 T9SS type A sorting domain-containing protein [Mesonia profundi]